MTQPTRLRLAISGTYGVGKTTTAEAVAIAAGIPRTHALTSREILADLVPGKTVQELTAMELVLLGLRRLEERIHNEAAIDGSFVSDGSVIHEWVYGEARMRVGINPGAGVLLRTTKAVLGLPSRRFYQRYMNNYGIIVKNRAKRLYDAYVHLPWSSRCARTATDRSPSRSGCCPTNCSSKPSTSSTSPTRLSADQSKNVSRRS